VLISHGRADSDLAFAAGESLRDCLTTAGAATTWVPFDQGHEVPLVVWRRLRKFLLERCVTGPDRTR
jgi:phospholipase/carboxylesterase